MAVYFIQAGSADGPIKIGKADDVEKRLHNLQTASPYELTVLAVIKNETEDRKYHPKFSDDHIRGEWFRASKALMNFIASIPKSECSGLFIPPRPLSVYLDQPQFVNPSLKDVREQPVIKKPKTNWALELDSILAKEECKDDLVFAFTFMNPLEFAKHLHSMEKVPDKLKSELLRLKVGITRPESDALVEQIVDHSMVNFWKRIEVEQGVTCAN